MLTGPLDWLTLLLVVLPATLVPLRPPRAARSARLARTSIQAADTAGARQAVVTLTLGRASSILERSAPRRRSAGPALARPRPTHSATSTDVNSLTRAVIVDALDLLARRLPADQPRIDLIVVGVTWFRDER